MSDLNAEIKIGADASGVEAGVGKAKRQLADLGEAAKRTGKAGGEGLAPIGDGATAAAKKVEAATKNTISSIQRQIAAFEAGGKSARGYQESLARQRGIDVGALKPYLDQLDAAKLKQKQAADSSTLLSTGLTTVKFAAAAAVGSLAAWVVSINNGVDALNDIKDATGASIENISALEDIARRTGTSFDTVGSALIKLNQALSTAKPGSDTEKALTAIGLSVKDLKALDPAEAFRRIAVELNKFADDGNKARLSQELFGKSLREVAPLLKDVAESGGLVAKVTTAQAQAAEDLNKQLFNLQANTSDLARGFVNELIPSLNNLAIEMAAAKKTSLGFFDGFLTQLGQNPFKSVGENAAAYRKEIQGLEEDRLRYQRSGSDTSAIDASLVALKRRLEYYKEIQLQQVQISKNDQSAAETRRLTGAAGGLRSVGDINSGPTAAQIAAQAAAVKAARAQAVKDDIEGFKLMQAAQDDYDKALADSIKAREKYNQSFEKSADAVAKSLQGLQDEEAALALSTASNISLAQAIAEVEIARLREQLLREKIADNPAGELAIQREIDLRRQLATAIDSKDARTAAKDSAKNAADEWKRTADKIEQDITDALMRGFESGKGFAENLRDTLVNMFKTLVLRPTIQATVQEGLGVLGLGGSAGGLGGTGSGLSLLSAGKGLYSTGQGLYSAYQAGGVSGAFGSVFGSAAPAAGSSMYAGGYSASGALSGGNLAAGSGSAASGSAGFAGIPIAGWIALGMIASGEAYDKGFRADGSGDYKVSDGGYFGINGVLNLTDNILQGLGIDGKTAAILSGSALGAQFMYGVAGGYKVSQDGQFLQGSIGAGGSQLQNRTDYTQDHRGVFGIGSFTTHNSAFSAADPKLSSFFDSAAKGAVKVVEQWAAAVGVGSEKLKGVAFALDLNLSNLKPEEIQAKLAGAVGGFGDALALSIVGEVDAAGALVNKYAKVDPSKTGAIDPTTGQAASVFETASQTLQRLTESITTVNGAFDLMGTALLDVSLTGAASASKIADAFGGLQKFTQSIGSYFDNFYSAAEKRAGTVGGITEALNAAGGNFTGDQIGALTREAYRGIVEATKASLGADSPLYVALITMSGAFASITPAVQSAAEAVRSLTDITNERKGLQNQLDDLTVNSAELLAKQRNALDESNRALFDQVQAASAAAKATQSFNDALGGLESASFDLENQLLSLQGQSSLVASRTRTSELASLTQGVTNPDDIARIQAQYDYNVSLGAQVAALNAAQQAAADYASQQQQAASSAANAAEQVRSAWQSVTDSLVGEASRIRGQLGTPAQSFAQAKAAFSITAAQASAGDQTAAKALPELSRVLLPLAQAQATSLLQLQILQGTTAGTLETIAKKYVSQFGVDIPQFAVSPNYVPADMLAVVHKVEPIVPAAYNPATFGPNNNDALAAEIRALRAEVAALRALHVTGNESAKITADTLRRVTRGGDAMQTQEFV